MINIKEFKEKPIEWHLSQSTLESRAYILCRFYGGIEKIYNSIDKLSAQKKYFSLARSYEELMEHIIIEKNLDEIRHYEYKHISDELTNEDKKRKRGYMLDEFETRFDNLYKEYLGDMYEKERLKEYGLKYAVRDIEKYKKKVEEKIAETRDLIDTSTYWDNFKLPREVSELNGAYNMSFKDVINAYNEMIKTNLKKAGYKNKEELKYGAFAGYSMSYNLRKEQDIVKKAYNNFRTPNKEQIEKTSYKIKEVRKGGLLTLLDNVVNLRFVTFMEAILKFGITKHVIESYYPETINAITQQIEKIPEPIYKMGSTVIETTKNAAEMAMAAIPESITQQGAEVLEKGTKIIDDVSGVIAEVGAPVGEFLSQVNPHVPAAAIALLTVVGLGAVASFGRGITYRLANSEQKLLQSVIDKIKNTQVYEVVSETIGNIGRGR